MAASSARRGIWIGLLAVVVLLVGLGVWFALSARTAVNEMTVARDSLMAARDAVADGQPQQARTFVTAASDAAGRASDRVNGPLWNVAAAIPGLGDTPQTAQAVATSLDQTLTALQPLTEQLDVLDPTSLISEGTVDVSAIQSALPAMKEAAPGVDEAVATVADAPVDGLVLPQVRTAAQDYTEELLGVQSTLSTGVTFGEIAGPLLGADGPKRYFVGILNPNEARGTGGFMGSWAIVSAKDGKVTVDQVGSNTQIPGLTALPAGLGDGFVERYRDDPTLVGNMNLSPNFPDTAKIWLAAWRQKTGERLDGAIAADVVALGDLVEASGAQVPLPNGTSLTGDQLADFAIKGIYVQFPTAAQVAERKAYQDAIVRTAVEVTTQAPNPEGMAEAMGKGLSEGRIVVWSADPKVEKKLVAAGVGGSLAVADGHNVQFVALNGSGSKLDAFLERSLTYEVGRCLNTDERVKSTVTVELENAIALGERPPEYMRSGIGRDGTTNVILAQFHLPNGADIEKVTVTGKSVSWFPFTESGRPSAMVDVTLPPREPVSVAVRFTEPASDKAADVAVQPLATDQPTQAMDAGCTER